MDIKKLIAATLFAGGPIFAAMAQMPDLTGDFGDSTDSVKVETPAVADSPAAHQYFETEYAGFKFELPAGIMINQEESFVAKYPDGSFGVSMVKEAQKNKQKYAYEICRRNVDQMRLKNATVEKVTIGGCAGAIGRGTLEGQTVTFIVLPSYDQQWTTVILASPNRNEWVDHFIKSLKR